MQVCNAFFHVISSPRFLAIQGHIMRPKRTAAKTEDKLLMSAAEMDLALSRIAAEIIENNNQHEFAIIGIRRRGVPLAERLCSKIQAVLQHPVTNGILDITLYRDDLTTVGPRPTLRSI
jgi:pyrimidine operon attenuation protein/uracil phosphoribosyltransferase